MRPGGHGLAKLRGAGQQLLLRGARPRVPARGYWGWIFGALAQQSGLGLSSWEALSRAACPHFCEKPRVGPPSI
jgi:hypothetical protein